MLFISRFYLQWLIMCLLYLSCSIELQVFYRALEEQYYRGGPPSLTDIRDIQSFQPGVSPWNKGWFSWLLLSTLTLLLSLPPLSVESPPERFKRWMLCWALPSVILSSGMWRRRRRRRREREMEREQSKLLGLKERLRDSIDLLALNSWRTVLIFQ